MPEGGKTAYRKDEKMVCSGVWKSEPAISLTTMPFFPPEIGITSGWLAQNQFGIYPPTL